MRGRHHHGPGAAGGQRGDHQALLVDGDVHDPQADRGRRAHRLVGRGPAVAGILERHRADPGLARQRAQYQVEPLREAGADDHRARVGGGRAHPPQVPGQHLAQRGAAARVAVAEVGRGDGAAGLADRPHPVGPREARQVGDPVREVRDQPAGKGRPGRLGGDRARGRLRRPCPDVGDSRRRAGPAGQVPLGEQLAEALLHDAPGHAELPRQLTRGRQPFPAAQPAAPDRVPHGRLELRAQRPAGRPVEPHEQLRAQTGPLNRHGIGPYQ